MLKRTLLAGTAICGLVAAGGAAQAGGLFVPEPADVPQRSYVGIAGGGNFVEDMDLISTFGAGPFDLIDGPRHLNFDDGFVGSAVLGFLLGHGFRLEGEAAYRNNDVDSVTVQGEGTAARSGDVEAFSLMANGWYDVDLAENVQMHVGGGIGVAWLWLDASNISVDEFAAINDHETVFAYQAGAGFSYRLEDGAKVTLDYRYFGTADPDFTMTTGGASANAGGEYHSHSVLFGIRVPTTTLAGGG